MMSHNKFYHSMGKAAGMADRLSNISRKMTDDLAAFQQELEELREILTDCADYALHCEKEKKTKGE